MDLAWDYERCPYGYMFYHTTMCMCRVRDAYMIFK